MRYRNLKNKHKHLSCLIYITLGWLFINYNLYAEVQVQRFGDIFKNLNEVFLPFAKLLFTIATIAGLLFTFIAVFKFKQFKDNPQQISIGQPVGLFFLGAIMLWLPFIIQSLGFTITGSKSIEELRRGQSVVTPSSETGFGKDLKSIH